MIQLVLHSANKKQQWLLVNKIALAAGKETLESIKMRGQRGMLIVFEGLDRSGKSTQVKLLHEALNSMNRQCEVWRYPNRTTSIGKLINSYLNKEIEMEDHAVHLLFSANRWETVGEMTTALNSGTNLILDRWKALNPAINYLYFIILLRLNLTDMPIPELLTRRPSPALMWTGASSVTEACPNRTWCASWIRNRRAWLVGPISEMNATRQLTSRSWSIIILQSSLTWASRVKSVWSWMPRKRLKAYTRV